jgi:hypothetical protein
MKTIDKVKAYCVINKVTMQQVSQFYRCNGDAEAWIAKATRFDGVFTEEYKAKWHYCVAELKFDKYYVID